MSTAAKEAAGAAPGGVVVFEHRFFKSFPDIYFHIPELTTEPVATIKLGDQDVALGFLGIKSEFAIADDSPDGQMLELVAKGLTFVKALRMGDLSPRRCSRGKHRGSCRRAIARSP